VCGCGALLVRVVAGSAETASRHQRALVRWTVVLSFATVAYAVAAFLPLFLRPAATSGAPATAWVLWMSASGTAPNGASYAGTQFPDSVYESRDGCYRAAKNLAGPTGPTLLRREDQNVWIVLHPSGPDAGVTNRYECWPDTVDPRGPKGK